MDNSVLLHNIKNHLCAIRLCLDNHLRIPALILIYSGIDMMAALSRPAKAEKVIRADYIDWAERYMRCKERLGVSGIELYAARCGVIHTATADSQLSNEGKARKIFYAWGDRQTDEPMSLLAALGIDDVVVLKVEGLATAFSDGIVCFGDEIDQDAELAFLIRGRADKLFMDRVTFPGL